MFEAEIVADFMRDRLTEFETKFDTEIIGIVFDPNHTSAIILGILSHDPGVGDCPPSAPIRRAKNMSMLVFGTLNSFQRSCASDPSSITSCPGGMENL